MADTEMYFLVQWEDRFVGIIRPKDVKQPQKKISEYQEGEIIQAAFQKKIYHAVISEIHPNKKFLQQQLKLPLKYEYHRQAYKTTGPADGVQCDSALSPAQRELPISVEPSLTQWKEQDDAGPADGVQCESALSPAQRELPISVEPSLTERKEQDDAGPEGAENVLSATGRGSQSQTFVGISSPERIIQAGTSSRKEKAGTAGGCVIAARSDGWEDECRSLRRKIRRMEERITALESQNSKVEDPELLAVEHLSDTQEVLVTLAKSIFTVEELKTHSRTGKMTNKCKDSPRPPLEPSKLSNLERLAEELNTIIGNAFKMAYAQQKTRQPTFNELIEKQLVEQKAKFAEYQEQANRALQQRLNEIATPTALQRMEMRRQSSSDDLLESNCSTPTTSEKDAKNKIWAKQALEKATHRSQAADSPLRCNSPTFSSSRPTSQQQQGSRKSDPNFSATKRNSTPVQLSPSKSSNFNSNANSPKRNSSPHLANLQNFQVVTIRESLENNVNNSNRFKGSPVTALKDEIDRRYLSNGGGGTLDSGLGWGIGDDMDSLQRLKMNHHYDNEDQLQAPPTPPSKMQNRPLPAIPASSDFNDHRASPKLRNWTSLDDDVIPNHTRSTMQSRLRDSPKRRPQRPQSEVILDSKLSVFSGGGVDQPGVYIYGFKSQTQNELSKNCNVLNSNQLSNVNISPQFSNRSMQNPQSRDTNTQQRYSPKVNNSNHQYSPKGNNFTQTGYDNMNSLQNGKSSPPIHYQNGSPSHNAIVDHGEESSSAKKEKGAGLESLMGLDRSHIEDETLRHSCWYQAGIPRDVALEILQQEDIGSFIVRDSSTHPGCYALSVRVPKFENPTGISHYLILKTARGVKLKGLDKEWSSLFSLVTHHTVMPEMLPCTLRLPRDTNNPAFKPSDKDEKEEDPDYQRLADFSSMMEALKK